MCIEYPSGLLECSQCFRDPRFIREFKAKHCIEVFAENITTKKKYAFFVHSYSKVDMAPFSGRSYGGGRTNRSLIILGRSNFDSCHLNTSADHCSNIE